MGGAVVTPNSYYAPFQPNAETAKKENQNMVMICRLRSLAYLVSAKIANVMIRYSTYHFRLREIYMVASGELALII